MPLGKVIGVLVAERRRSSRDQLVLFHHVPKLLPVFFYGVVGARSSPLSFSLYTHPTITLMFHKALCMTSTTVCDVEEAAS